MSIPPDELLEALSAVRRAVRRRADRPVELLALTGAQLELVRLLRREPGVSIADAAARLRVAPNTVSTLVGQLADSGVVERRTDEADRRVVRLTLTPSVRRRVDAWRDRRVDALGDAITRLSDADRVRLDEAVPALVRLADELQLEDPEGMTVLADAGPAPALPALSCCGVRHRFGDHVALDGVDLTVDQGEVFGLLGPNGAGKTTAIRLMNTLLPLQEGEIFVAGYDVRRSPMAVRRLLGYVPQQLSIEAALTGRENVTWFARLFDVPRSERQERVAAALAAMGLADSADRLAGTYSGGMIRRLELAQALVNRPAVLVLDEPTVGLDPVARDGVWQRVEELRAASEMTVLLTTHYLEEADALCDRVALMHLGAIRAVGTPEELKAAIGPEATLEDVFRRFTGQTLAGDGAKGGLREIRRTRRTARRVG